MAFGECESQMAKVHERMWLRSARSPRDALVERENRTETATSAGPIPVTDAGGYVDVGLPYVVRSLLHDRLAARGCA